MYVTLSGTRGSSRFCLSVALALSFIFAPAVGAILY